MVTSKSLSNPADADTPGHSYMMSFGLRLFNPIAYVTLACPIRGENWALNSTALDFRAAQNEAAMQPRDGPWYSSDEENLHGNVVLTSPLQGKTLQLPEEMFISARVSWSPPHVVIRFVNAEVIRKISFIPVRDAGSNWHHVNYENGSFPDEVRLAHPLMFWIPTEIPENADVPTSSPAASTYEIPTIKIMTMRGATGLTSRRKVGIRTRGATRMTRRNPIRSVAPSL